MFSASEGLYRSSTNIGSSIAVSHNERLIRPATLLWQAALIVLALSYSPFALTDNSPPERDGPTSSPFYQQLHNNSYNRSSREVSSLLDQVAPEQSNFEDAIAANPGHEDDLAFNYLWMQQHQQGYSDAQGGSAAGKLLRMSVKKLYRNRYGSNSGDIRSEDDLADNISSLGYRLRLSADRVKLGIEYEF